MKQIDINQWKRREHFSFFYRMDYPHFNICFDLDVTALVPELKNLGLPFYFSIIYLSTAAANSVEEFRYRMRGDEVIIHESLRPAFTDMSEGSDLFRMVAVDMDERLDSFVRNAAMKSRSQQEYFRASDFNDQDDYIYITSIPWISFTHISHTISLNKNDSVPRISWGKYYNRDGRTLLPFSVQVNHCFVDGIHVAEYKKSLEELILRVGQL